MIIIIIIVTSKNFITDCICYYALFLHSFFFKLLLEFQFITYLYDSNNDQLGLYVCSSISQDGFVDEE